MRGQLESLSFYLVGIIRIADAVLKTVAINYCHQFGDHSYSTEEGKRGTHHVPENKASFHLLPWVVFHETLAGIYGKKVSYRDGTSNSCGILFHPSGGGHNIMIFEIEV